MQGISFVAQKVFPESPREHAYSEAILAVSVQAYMGHANVQTTIRYVHHVPELT